MNNIQFKLVIEVDGSVSHTEDLGAECLNALVNRFQDVSDNFELFGYLAQSASSEVRKDVAYKESLSEETIELLARDTCIDVRRNLSGQAPFREWASTEIALQFLRDDVECAKNIAGNLGDFTTAGRLEKLWRLKVGFDSLGRRCVGGGDGRAAGFL